MKTFKVTSATFDGVRAVISLKGTKVRLFRTPSQFKQDCKRSPHLSSVDLPASADNLEGATFSANLVARKKGVSFTNREGDTITPKGNSFQLKETENVDDAFITFAITDTAKMRLTIASKLAETVAMSMGLTSQPTASTEDEEEEEDAFPTDFFSEEEEIEEEDDFSMETEEETEDVEQEEVEEEEIP